MFTGIVQEIVTVTQITPTSNGRRLSITCPQTEQFVVGDSILLNGICSTVVEVSATELAVEYMPQTERLTTVQLWQVGGQLNCEAPLTLQTKLSGSLVMGHVDTLAEVKACIHSAAETSLQITFTQALPATVVPQGSITIDGVNLTIASVIQPQLVECKIIPHTFNTTVMQSYQAGGKVNIEFDYIAKLLLSRTESVVAAPKK